MLVAAICKHTPRVHTGVERSVLFPALNHFIQHGVLQSEVQYISHKRHNGTKYTSAHLKTDNVPIDQGADSRVFY